MSYIDIKCHIAAWRWINQNILIMNAKCTSVTQNTMDDMQIKKGELTIPSEIKC